MQVYSPGNSVLAYLDAKKQQDFTNQLAAQQEGRLAEALRLQQQQFAQNQAIHNRQMMEYERADTLAKALGQLLPPTTPGLSPQQFEQMKPEMAAFGTSGLEDAMQYANQPNPLADMLQNLPPQALGAFAQHLLLPEDLTIVPEGATAVGKRTGTPAYTNPYSTKAPTFKDMPISPTQAQRYQLDPVTRTWSPFGVPFNMHGAGTTVNVGQPVSVINPQTGKPELVQFPNKPGGKPQFTGLEPGGQGKPSEFESKAGMYWKSMSQATQTLRDLETKHGLKVAPSMVEAAAPEGAANVVRGQVRQSYNQAARQWIDSINRVRSGAQLPEYEYHRAVATFFPVFGDSLATIQQKAAARQQEEEAMKAAAGTAMPRVPAGVETPPPPAASKAPVAGGTIAVNGKTYNVLKVLGTGSLVLQDPTTGKTFLHSKKK